MATNLYTVFKADSDLSDKDLADAIETIISAMGLPLGDQEEIDSFIAEQTAKGKGPEDRVVYRLAIERVEL